MEGDKTSTSSNPVLPVKHTCSKCGYSTRNKILHDNHSCDQQDEDNNLEEQTLITLMVDEAKKFHCSECDVWAQGHAFEEHLMCHIILKPYQCLYCSQCFVNRRDIGRHVVKEHVGKKMNCALRALKRAKGLMKATLESGTFQFYACVAGKVPLPGDPEKNKAKQKKSKSETEGHNKESSKMSSVLSESGVSNKDTDSLDRSSPKPSNGQEEAGHSSSASKSCRNSSGEVSPSNKTPEDPKEDSLPSSKDTVAEISNTQSQQVQRTAQSAEPAVPQTDEMTNLETASSEPVQTSLPQAGETNQQMTLPAEPAQTLDPQRDETSKLVTTLAEPAQSAESSVPHTGEGAEVVITPAETTDQTANKNEAANSKDKVTKTVDPGSDTVETMDWASTTDEMGLVNKPDETNSSATALIITSQVSDSAFKEDEPVESPTKAVEKMDVDHEKVSVTETPTRMEERKNVSTKVDETVDSTTKEDGITITDEIVDSDNMETSDTTSKMNNDMDASSEASKSDDTPNDGKPSILVKLSENGDAAPILDKETDVNSETEPSVSTCATDETKTNSSEDMMDIPPSADIKDSAQTTSDTTGSTEKDTAVSSETDKTSVSSCEGEEISGVDAKTNEAVNSAMESEEAIYATSTQGNSASKDQVNESDDSLSNIDRNNETEESIVLNDKTDESKESKIGEFEHNCKENSKTAVENEIQMSDDAKESKKSCSFDELSPKPADVLLLGEERDTDDRELSERTEDAQAEGNEESMEMEGIESTTENPENIKTSSTESEGKTETSSKLKPDSSHIETGTEQSKEDGEESSKAKDLEFPSSNFDQSEEEESGVGLKIVAAFSLQEHDTKEGNDTDSQVDFAKAGAEKEKTKNTDMTPTKEQQQDPSDAPNTSSPEQSSVPRTLGPPSKPVPSSSFLGVCPSADSITSQGFASKHVPQKNCFFFVCGFSCSFSCLTSPEFRDHLMLDHAGESSFSCFHCGFQSPSEDGLVRHISAHAHTYSKSVPLYICGASACKFGSNLVNDFITHQSAWHPELTTFHCHDCDERFDSIEELLRHFEANFLHIINCPHCTAKTTERRTLLSHISAAHPGKPKMVSVAKQIVCRDRKLNSYTQFMQVRNQITVVVPASPSAGDRTTPEQSGASHSRTKSLVSILTQPIQPQERELTRQAAATAQNLPSVKQENIVDEDEDDFFQENFDDSFDEEEYGIQSSSQSEITYMGSKPDDREIDNFKCQFCTFIARDRCRLEGHERCHGLPPSRKSRFKCMYCPQGFNNEHKFNSHVSCHPGLIKFSLYCCKYCDFDSNQRHIIVKHVRTTRDQVHMGYETNEDDMFAVLNKTMESRVLECNQCSYMTRHRKHLVAHLKREHSNQRKTGITVDCDIVEKYPSQSVGANRNKALEMAMSHDHAAQLPVGDDGFVKENQARRFKCPICQYLVPRAADLKAHVKRHSEIGEITLVMFRCKYCSAASTAREIIYGHLMEKHLGKQIALVKRIVTIDTRGNDNGYAVTSMEDEDGQGESQSYPDDGGPSGSSSKAVLVIPDSAGETFTSLMQCPSCAFGSYNRKTIVQHVSNHHPEVSIMGRRHDNELYALETTYSTPATATSAAHFTLGEALKGEILIVPDSQTFDEAVLCPKCDYATIHRRNIVLHLEQNHPEVSVMGRNDYPTFDGKGQAAVEANATGKDGMVIIGSGSLDEKIRCLYENFGDRMKCMICQAERPKKFFIHVHILRHLNILLWGCQFCSHKGLQKYKMMDHIKKVHPGRAFCIRYLPVNVEERVNQYLQNASMIRARRSGEDGDHISSSKNSLSDCFQSAGADNDLNVLRLKYKASQDRLSGCTIGSEELDMKLACLYSMGSDNRYRCVVCGQEFQRKFAVHRHIVQSHLKVNLIGCGYCDLEGVERHIMMDHIIETHKNAPISMRNLAQNLENKVSDFLSRMTLAADDTLDLPATELGLDGDFKLPEPPQLTPAISSKERRSPQRGTPPRTASPSASGGKNQLNPNLLLLGRDILHKHLASMIREVGSSFCCEVCKWDFPRKYAVHRHILMKHLKIGIIGCPYCAFEGVERYQVFTHIREDHKDAELSLRYLSVDLDTHVGKFMKNLANGNVEMYSRSTPPWSMKKTPKKEILSDEDSQEAPSTSSDGGQGLVVAMFGSKKSAVSIKEEPMDDDDALGQEPLDREVNGDESNSYAGLMGDDGEREVSSTSLLAANGTKAKVATDVQTNIRVITIKEKGFKRHICEKCKFTSLHRSNIVRHIYRVHEQYREHECPACNYKTLSRVLIEQHITNEHPGTPLPELVINKGVKRKMDMSHEELEYDSMKKCKAAATSKRREADLPLLNSATTQLYACAYCNYETMTHSEIVQHTRENHSLGEPMKQQEEEEGGKDTETGQQVEGQEDSEFDSVVNMVKVSQMDLSSGQEDALWQCFYCSFKTASEEDLKIHFAQTHPGNIYRAKKVPAWRFVCRSCHVKTRAHSKMRYHLNRHINYRPYTCTTCGSFYPSPDQCRKHCRANNHNETFTYVKIPRKERRLQELLKECQEIAAALARNPASADAYTTSATLSQPIPSKRKAKKSFSAHSHITSSKMRKNYEYDAPYSPRGSGAQVQRDDRPKEDDSVMVCASCDFSAQNVCDVWLHFIKEHEEQEFRWLDSSTGYICTETGEITNAKDNPPDLEAPPGPGYTMMSSRLLNCEHCEFTTSTVQAMKSHLRRHLPKRYLCPYCSLRCSRRDTITQHVRCGHRGRELWTIFFRLPEGFVADSDNAESNLEPGAAQGQDEEQQPSKLAAGSSASASMHDRIKCGQCDMGLENVAAVYQHHKEHHPEMDFLWVDITNGYTCNRSGEVMDAKEQSPHLFTQDGYTVEQDGSNVATYCCKFCPFTSAFIQAIKSHMKSHLPHGFMCPYCCMITNSKEKMMSHQSCMHREQEPWILHLRMPSDAASMVAPVPSESSDVSVARQQRGVTQYACNECEYTSENLYQYRLHLANHGSFPHLIKDVPDDLPFRCGYCVYVAEDEGDFGAHIASHLERRNFRCSKCEYTAFKRSAVQNHIQTTHDETEEIEVIDLQAHNISEQGGSVEEPQLVNLEPKVKVVPVNELDLDREGLTLFSPPSTPDEEGQEMRQEGEDMDIIGLETPSVAELDNQSDSTEEWGGNDEDLSHEGSPAPSDHTPAPPGGGGSILRLTLQGKLTGEYGIKRAVAVDKDGDLTDASASGDSLMSAPSEPEDIASPEPQHDDEEEEPLIDQSQEAEAENDDDADVDNEEEDNEVENEENEDADPENEEEGAEIENEEDEEMENEEDHSPEQVEEIENSAGFEPLEEDEAEEVDGGEERSEGEGEEGMDQGEEVEERDVGNVFSTMNSWLDE